MFLDLFVPAGGAVELAATAAAQAYLAGEPFTEDNDAVLPIWVPEGTGISVDLPLPLGRIGLSLEGGRVVLAVSAMAAVLIKRHVPLAWSKFEGGVSRLALALEPDAVVRVPVPGVGSIGVRLPRDEGPIEDG